MTSLGPFLSANTNLNIIFDHPLSLPFKDKCISTQYLYQNREIVNYKI
jgi:hypothetical protein